MVHPLLVLIQKTDKVIFLRLFQNSSARIEVLPQIQPWLERRERAGHPCHPKGSRGWGLGSTVALFYPLRLMYCRPWGAVIVGEQLDLKSGVCHCSLSELRPENEKGKVAFM